MSYSVKDVSRFGLLFETSSLVEEAAAASEAMGAQSEELTALVSYFRLHQDMLVPMIVEPAPLVQQSSDLTRLQGRGDVRKS